MTACVHGAVARQVPIGRDELELAAQAGSQVAGDPDGQLAALARRQPQLGGEHLQVCLARHALDV